MNANNLFTKEQHGCIKEKSCVTQLVECVADITAAIHQGYDADAIYLNFTKAFDIVTHRRLLEKLWDYEIRGNIPAWIRDFLSQRKQLVTVNGACSWWRHITSGFTQGSALGRILFQIRVFKNDLPEVLKCLIKLLADDAKLYQVIKTDQDRIELRGDVRTRKTGRSFG